MKGFLVLMVCCAIVSCREKPKESYEDGLDNKSKSPEETHLEISRSVAENNDSSVVIKRSSVGTISEHIPMSNPGLYYKPVGETLVLGNWDGKEKFEPVNPSQVIDLRSQFPVNLKYPILIPPDGGVIKMRYTTDDGVIVDRIFDPKTGEVKEMKVEAD